MENLPLVYLRAMEPEDIEKLYVWENDESLWHVSHTLAPFSKHTLEQFILNEQAQDLFASKQLRLMAMLSSTKETIGMIDLYDFDPLHQRAGIGILIHRDFQHKGYGKATVEALIFYVKKHLPLHQLYCQIASNNHVSKQLFTSLGFRLCGIKKDWLHIEHQWQDEEMYQLVFE